MDAAQVETVHALRAAGQHTQALAMLLDLHRANPNDAVINYELGCTYDPQGLEDDAIPFYERALEIGLNDAMRRACLLGLGSSYRCVERFSDAIRILQKGAAEFPEAKEFDIFLALARHNVGEHAEAMRLLLHHIAEYSNEPQTKRYQRAVAYYAEHLAPPYD
jgi:tetratricopeptide (TPR) repeat protein